MFLCELFTSGKIRMYGILDTVYICLERWVFANKALLFQSFLKGDTQIMADEAFQNAIQNYYDVFLKSERVVKMVQSGACSQYDFREVFRNNIEKRVRYVEGTKIDRVYQKFNFYQYWSKYWE